MERILPSASMDQIVDRYVQDHMFDDDAYDPVESAYREAHADAQPGAAYPKALTQVTKEIIGGKEMRKEAEPFDAQAFFLARMFNIANVLQKLGVPEDAALPATFFLVVGVGAGSIMYGFTSYLAYQRQNFLKEMRGRYGEKYR